MPYIVRCKALLKDGNIETVCGTEVLIPDPEKGQTKTEADCPRCHQRYQIPHYPAPIPYAPPARKVIHGIN